MTRFALQGKHHDFHAVSISFIYQHQFLAQPLLYHYQYDPLVVAPTIEEETATETMVVTENRRFRDLFVFKE